MSTAWLRYPNSSALAMKPALSPMTTGILPSRSTSAWTSSTMASSVTTVRTTSTSFCTWAGLKKCIPTTLRGCSVATEHPRRVVGMHFFNPAQVQKLVEVVRTVVTEEAIVEDVQALVERLGKMPVVIGDKAGFIANALLFGYLNHAVDMYESRYATREDIDAAMQLGCGLPMGPLALMDLIGLDTAYEILDTMYKQGRDRLHAPSPIIKQMVTGGLKGRKTGRGFYTYDEAGSSKAVADSQTPLDGGAHEVGLRTVKTVGVVGSGTMATGIIEV